MKVMNFSFLLLLLTGLMGCVQGQRSGDNKMDRETQGEYFVDMKGDTIYYVSKSEEQWKAELTAVEFNILREAGTERAFTGKYWDYKEKGIYTCAGCGLPLFSSTTKFKSGTGWPSFTQPVDETHVLEKKDNSLGMSRTEVLCARCYGHLGHVFDDGPEPTGLRYCLNSAALGFEEK